MSDQKRQLPPDASSSEASNSLGFILVKLAVGIGLGVVLVAIGIAQFMNFM